MTADPFVIERLVYDRWGGVPVEDEVDRPLERIARREGWTFCPLADVNDATSNYRALEWRDRWGAGVGWSLHMLNIGVSGILPLYPCGGPPGAFHPISS